MSWTENSKIRSHCKCTKIYPWVGVYGFRKNIKNIALDLDVFTLKIMESHLNHTWFRCYMGVHDHGQVWDDTEIICMCMCIGCIYVAWVVISWKNVAANIECPIDIQLGEAPSGPVWLICKCVWVFILDRRRSFGTSSDSYGSSYFVALTSSIVLDPFGIS